MPTDPYKERLRKAGFDTSDTVKLRDISPIEQEFGDSASIFAYNRQKR